MRKDGSKSKFWEAVERAAREVETWPDWKRAGVLKKRCKRETSDT